MNDRSIESQAIKEDNSLPEIVRKSFRVPIEDKDKVWVIMNENRYRVLDICLNGIGIALDKREPFTIEQVFLNCELNIFNVSINKLSGQIVHLTSTKGKNWQCGIQWIDIKKDTADKLFSIVSKMKEQLLKGETIAFD